MRYLAIHLRFDNKEDFVADVLADYLGKIGFESFVTTDEGLDAYIPEKNFSEQEFETALKRFPLDVAMSYVAEEMEDKNWNEEWEKHYFEPIVIGSECVIHSSFHKNIPDAKYDIVIDPKMSFGTGHHETTSLMIGELLQIELEGKTVLDMGCGTSVLAILASKRGAKKILAIDIDTWCVENSIENIALNNVDNVEVMLGGADLLKGMHFDIILANINRNILLADMAKYAACLSSGGKLYMSGFYEDDIYLIEAEAFNNNLQLNDFSKKNNWVAVETTKN